MKISVKQRLWGMEHKPNWLRLRHGLTIKVSVIFNRKELHSVDIRNLFSGIGSIEVYSKETLGIFYVYSLNIESLFWQCLFGFIEFWEQLEGIYFDLLTEANIPTKTLQSADGNKITLTPYGVSRLDEDWAYPDDDLIMETPVNSVVVISTDGERTDIITINEDNGTVTTDLDRISLVTTGDIGSGNFTIGFGTILNVENISGVEINGVSYTEWSLIPRVLWIISAHYTGSSLIIVREDPVYLITERQAIGII